MTDLEKTLIGSIFENHNHLDEVLDNGINADMFFHDAAIEIWREMLVCRTEKICVDLSTIGARLPHRIDFMTDSMIDLPVIEHFSQLCKQISEKQ